MKNKLFVALIGIFLFGFVYGGDLSVGDFDESLGYVPGEIIVKYKHTINRDRKLSAKSSDVYDAFDDLKIVENLDTSSNVVLMEITDDKTVEEVIDILSDDENVEYVEPNYIRYAFALEDFNTDDPLKNNQWGLDYISRSNGFNAFSGKLSNPGNDVYVGIIDNGVNYYHSDLKDSVWDGLECTLDGEEVNCQHGYDFIHNLPTPLPNVDTHGTHIAGIIAAGVDNGTGIIGVNPYAKIAALKIGRARSFTVADEVRAIRFAIENNIKILNASYGSNYSSDIERQAIEDFLSFGGLFITAAGNGRNGVNVGLNIDQSPVYPCSYDLDNVICVASLDEDGGLARYSNYGNKSVDIAAPGTNILSTIIHGVDISSIFKEKFENCDTVGFVGGSCKKLSSLGNPSNLGYYFSDNVVLTGINLSGKRDVFVSFIASCYSDSLILQYSDDGVNFGEAIDLGVVNKNGVLYSVDVWSEYLTENFGLKITLVDGDGSRECAIDDVEIFEDPYVVNDNDSYGKSSGTSMATPFVVGLASMVWKIDPTLSYSQVKDFIMKYGDDDQLLSGKLVSGKYINVERTLDKVLKNIVGAPSGLISSWTGILAWNPSTGSAIKYYYEILDENDAVVSGGIVEDTGLVTGLLGNYKWRIQGVDINGDRGDFVDSYICEKPELEEVNISLGECELFDGNSIVDDGCFSTYQTTWSFGDDVVGSEVVMNNPGSLSRNLLVVNSFGEELNAVVNYNWEDTNPTLDVVEYNYTGTVKSSSKQTIGNVYSLFGVKDGLCGNSQISIGGIVCSEGSGKIENNNLIITAPSSKKGLSVCTVTFLDDEGNSVNGLFKYSFNTVANNGGGGGGGGGGGTQTYECKNLPANATANNTTTRDANETNYTYGTGSGCTFQCNTGYNRNGQSSKCEKESVHGSAVKTGNVKTGDKDELSKPDMLELFRESDLDFSWYNNSNPSIVLSNGFTVEFNNAYEFAHRLGITTTDSIQQANMTGKLTRIAMAKMLSQYAMNVLGKKPANIVVPDFPDVTSALDGQYDYGVSLAYQLGIMGQGITDFRPNDVVTRGEFATALSRMLFSVSDGKPYYSTHLKKLMDEGIIIKSDPMIQELRGYVMIMLMRSAKN